MSLPRRRLTAEGLVNFGGIGHGFIVYCTESTPMTLAHWEMDKRMDARIQNDLDAVKESILKSVPAEAIYLFVSYAYGTPNEGSDLDIYVVVPDDVENLSELYGNILSLLWGNKTVSLDMQMERSSVFNRRKNGPTLEKVVFQKGMMLYGN